MVKKIIVFVVIFLVILVGLHFAFYAFINAKGKDMIIGGIKKNFDADATISSLSVKFPFNLEIRDFKCRDLSFKKADVSLGLFNPFARKLTLSKVYIDGLDIKVIKDSQGVYIEPFTVKKGNGGFVEDKESKEMKIAEKESIETDVVSAAGETAPVHEEMIEQSLEKKFYFGVGKLYLKDSKAKVSYLHKDKGPIHVTFEGLELVVKNFNYPDLSKFSLKLDASVKTGRGTAEDVLHVKGWVDYLKRNMDLDVDIDSLDYYIFSQYYPNFWKPENLGVEEAVLSLEANLNSQNNDLIIDGILSLDKIDFTDQEGFPRRDLAKTAVALLQGNKEKPTLHFKLKTKMDSPDLDLSSLKGSFTKSLPLAPGIIIKEIFDKTKETIPEAAKEAKEIGEEAADTAVEAIKSVIGSIGDIFKPSKEKTPQEKPLE